MRVTSIIVTISEKINVENFENLDPSVQLTGELEPGDDPQKAYQELREIASEMWYKEAVLRVKALILRRRDTLPEDTEKEREKKRDCIRYAKGLLKSLASSLS